MTKTLLFMVRTFILAALMLVCFSATAQLSNRDSLLADYKILRSALVHDHPLMGDHISAKRFNEVADSLEQALGKVNTTEEFHLLVSQLVSQVKCAHTYAYPLQYIANRLKQVKDLPFSVVATDSAVFIDKIYQSKFNQYVQQQILKVNGVDVKTIMNKYVNAISSDGINHASQLYQFSKNFHYYLTLALQTPKQLEIETTAGVFVVNYPTGYKSKEDDYDKSISFKEADSIPSTVILTIRDFDEGKQAIKKCFSFISKHGIENLVIDLRDNPGGNGNIGTGLLNYLVDKKVTYYLDKPANQETEYIRSKMGMILSTNYTKDANGAKTYAFSSEQTTNDHYHGRIYVLINEGTLSTSAYVAAWLRYNTRAVFIGTETGGSANAIGAGVIGKLVLPYSGISVKFPLYRWRFNTSDAKAEGGIQPDIVINRLTDESAYMKQVMDVIRAAK